MLSEKDVATLATISSILEVSVKKPGNVSPEQNFSDTTYEDFLAGSIALSPGIEESVKRGFLAGKKKISLRDIKIGELIKKCILDVKKSHHPSGKNTHLGTILLMVPISAAVGICISQKNFNENKLKINVKKVIENSTLGDSLNFYDSVEIANANVGSNEKLKKIKIPFHELMRISAKKDRISQELTNGLKITFLVSKILDGNHKKINDIKKAILQTYLEILAKFPDTLIEKKLGKEKAKEIAEKAKGVVKKGGVFTKEGKEAIKKFDLYFKRKNNENNQLNPGTTADIIAAGLMIWFIEKNMMKR